MAIKWGQEEEKLVVKEGKGYGGLSVIQNASVMSQVVGTQKGRR